MVKCDKAQAEDDDNVYQMKVLQTFKKYIMNHTKMNMSYLAIPQSRRTYLKNLFLNSQTWLHQP